MNVKVELTVEAHLVLGTYLCTADFFRQAKMGLFDRIFQRRRRTHPFPKFSQNAWPDSSLSGPKVGDVVAARHDGSASSQESSDAVGKTERNQIAQTNNNNLAVLEQVKISKTETEGSESAKLTKRRRSTAKEREERMRRIVETLNRRRDAICTEAERNWLIQGACLQKHRHNLQVTHELTLRGLMCDCTER